MPLAREGEMDEWVFNLVKANVRERSKSKAIFTPWWQRNRQ